MQVLERCEMCDGLRDSNTAQVSEIVLPVNLILQYFCNI